MLVILLYGDLIFRVQLITKESYGKPYLNEYL